MKNPLNKRIAKELRSQWRKYVLTGLFLSLMIGLVSGMSVANESMLRSIDEKQEENHLEDGRFVLEKKADPALIKAIGTGKPADLKTYYTDRAKAEFDTMFKRQYANLDPSSPLYREAYDQAWENMREQIDARYEEARTKYGLNDNLKTVPVTIYTNFFKEAEEEKTASKKENARIRVYEQTSYINQVDVLEGRLPENENEIAIDQRHADNQDIQIGDRLRIGSTDFTVSGLAAFVTYTGLFEKNTDMVFDAITFDCGLVSRTGFERIEEKTFYNYAWTYEKEPADEKEAAALSEDLMKVIATQSLLYDNALEDFLPAWANQAIHFAPDDMKSDRVMILMVLYVLVVILAFVFALNITGAIEQESRTIGTLRAGGYSKKELVFHYLMPPVITVAAGALAGNVLGYTVFKDIMVALYYNSYSLPRFTTFLSANAFWQTTVVPSALVLLIVLVVLTVRLEHSPLEFIRKDLKRKRRHAAVRLPDWDFFDRFRIRIIMQNAGGCIVLFFGILFVCILLALAFGMEDTLHYYRHNAQTMQFAAYQYILNDAYEIEGVPDVERYSMETLIYDTGNLDEEISVYGVEPDSIYIPVKETGNLDPGEVIVSDAFRDKYHLKKGDRIILHEKYTNASYRFTIEGFDASNMSMAVYISRTAFIQTFDLDPDTYTGYFSATPLNDIPPENIAALITDKEITKMADQLMLSMGNMMEMVKGICLLLAVVLIYLLTKTILEKNERPISIVKILGYEDREIARLYLMAVSFVVVVFTAVSVFLGSAIMARIWAVMMADYPGWFVFRVSAGSMGRMFLMILSAYAAVLYADWRRIGRIPMDRALKDTE